MVVRLNSTMMRKAAESTIMEDRHITVQRQGMLIMANPKMMMNPMMTTTMITRRMMMMMKAAPTKTKNRMKKMKRRWKNQKRNSFQLFS